MTTAHPDMDAILLVEDEPLTRAALVTCLRAEGFQTIEASDAVEAIDALAAHRSTRDIGLVLLDIRLPRGSGLDVLRYLTAVGTYIPVVAMSLDTVQLTAAAQAGADAVLFKPFDLDHLVTIAASSMDSSRRLRARLAAMESSERAPGCPSG